MASPFGHNGPDHHAANVLCHELEYSRSFSLTEQAEKTFGASSGVAPFEYQAKEHLMRFSVGGTAVAGVLGNSPGNSPLAVVTREASHLAHNPLASRQLEMESDCGAVSPRGIPDHASEDHYSNLSPQQRNTQGQFRQFVSIDISEGPPKREDQQEKRQEAEPDTAFRLHNARAHKWWQKSADAGQEASQIAEDAFARVKCWREIFSALTGMHGVYVLANFAFENPAGGLCSLFCFFCSAFAQFDRRAPSYFLTALLSFCFGIVVAVSRSTAVRGFEAFAQNAILRRICVTQVSLLFLAAAVASMLGLRIMQLHRFLREPGVLIPLQCRESEAAAGMGGPGNTSEVKTLDAKKHVRDDYQEQKDAMGYGNPIGYMQSRRHSSDSGEATT
ncbi:hypothetical protein cyc_01333 [Cyclospora cayetanensis]|uniref:Transmembrane protein n=1 Tax=Cyclospora cayetanensis TaxID=88456 RepID=A0A1D3D1D4_9EIME|nr:hypothetical protein cyc_01333 [Cyclospora cayetanensis]